MHLEPYHKPDSWLLGRIRNVQLWAFCSEHNVKLINFKDLSRFDTYNV